VAAVGLGINAYQVGHVGTLNIGAVENLLADVVKLIGEDAPLYSEGIVGLLSDDAIGDLSEPPDA
jgi:hypothetical protein